MGGFTSRRRGLMESVALLVLCALFFILAVAAIATGVSAYNGTSQVIEDSNTYRTVLAYLSNQVRRGDSVGNIEVGRLFDSGALMIYETIDEWEYVTYIYCHDGFLRELFIEKGLEFEAEAGNELIPLEKVYFGVTADGQIMAAFTNGDEGEHMLITVRSNFESGVILP